VVVIAILFSFDRYNQDEEQSAVDSFANPIIHDYEYHDASLIRIGQWFYSFVSCVAPRDKSLKHHYYTVSIFRSSDLVHWDFYKYALDSQYIEKTCKIEVDRKFNFTGRVPIVDKNENTKFYAIWAPDIIEYKDKLYLFVALHRSTSDTKIAMFQSSNIHDDFTFKGVLASTDPKDDNAYVESEELIDPYPIVVDGKMYLMYGSFRRALSGKIIKNREKLGVYIAEVLNNNDTISLGERKFVTDYYEGCIVVPYNGKYYLFGTNGNLRNHYYQIHYACADNVMGPYLNSEGKSIADTINYNQGTPILVTKESDNFNGFGCPSYPIIDKNGQYWMMMLGHATDYQPIRADSPEKERYTFLIPLYWDKEGKPYFDVDEIQRNKIRKPEF